MKKDNVRHINNWKEFSLIADDLLAYNSFLFRGQSKSDWSLTPYLTRIFKKYHIKRKDALEIEKIALQSFRENTKDILEFSKFSKYNDEVKWQIVWWEIMQHYQTPTRLLDWTKCPYVALFFAVSDNIEKNGALFRFNDGYLNFIRNNRRIVKWPDIDLQLELSNKRRTYEKSIYSFSSNVSIDRKINQKGCYTISTEITENLDETHDKLADKLMFEGVQGGNGKSIIKKYVIDKKLKPILLKNLCSQKGINTSYIYPDKGSSSGGLDKIGELIKDDINSSCKIIDCNA